MRKEVVEGLIKVLSEPAGPTVTVILQGIDRNRTAVTEEVLVPADGSVVTSENVFCNAGNTLWDEAWDEYPCGPAT